MKTYVITLSKVFPKGHARAGEPTNFAQSLDNALNRDFMHPLICVCKVHTIRANYPLWAKRIAEVERGEACLSIRQWTAKPYASKQVEIIRLTKEDGVGIQKLEFHNGELLCQTIDGDYALADLDILAKNDGLSFDDWKEWFKGYDLTQPMAIIHFTKFRY